MKITWTQALEAMYGHQLTDKQIPVWEHYLISINATSAELVPAIEMAAAENIKPSEWRVTVRDLTKWVKLYRLRQKNNANSSQSKQRIQTFIQEGIEKIRRGGNRDDIIQAAYALPFDIVTQNEIINQILKEPTQ